MAFKRATITRMTEDRQERAGKVQGILAGVLMEDDIIAEPRYVEFELRGGALNQVLNAPDFSVAFLNWLKGEINTAHAVWIKEPPEKPVTRTRGDILNRLGTDTITEL